jgi:hypothetical protein
LLRELDIRKTADEADIDLVAKLPILKPTWNSAGRPKRSLTKETAPSKVSPVVRRRNEANLWQ